MSERELAEQLGVSRTSVRQALTALRAQGMVDIKHGDGVYLMRSPSDLIPNFAAEIADSEVDHAMIWEVREGIEVEAARLAAARREEGDLAAMRATLEAMADSVGEGGDGIAGDRAFHAAVDAASHNPLLRGVGKARFAEAIDRTSAASLTMAGRPPISLEAPPPDLRRGRSTATSEEAAERMRDHVRTSGGRWPACRALVTRAPESAEERGPPRWRARIATSASRSASRCRRHRRRDGLPAPSDVEVVGVAAGDT